MSVRKRVINVRSIVHSESSSNAEGFVLELVALDTTGSQYVVKLNLDWWMLPFLARELWGVLTRRRTAIEGELAAAEKALRG
jgi:hypothetical protein